MSLDEINALSLDQLQTVMSVLDRLFDNPVYEIIDGPTAYDRIDMVNKPTIATLQDELDEWKAELTAIENARLAYEARVADFTARWDAIEDIAGVMTEAGVVATNPALELNRIIEENDEATLIALEAAFSSWDPRRVNAEGRHEKIELGNTARVACERVLDLIAGHNLSRALTQGDVDSMQTAFTDIENALRSNRPDKARTLITAATPDGTLVTQAIKDDILDLLTEQGF